MRDYIIKMRRQRKEEVPYDATLVEFGADDYYEYYYDNEAESYNTHSSAGVHAQSLTLPQWMVVLKGDD
eukprot:10531115-Ditylum_brightwellii.AAC.1